MAGILIPPFYGSNLLAITGLFFPTVVKSSDIFFKTSAVLKNAVIEMYGMTGEKLYSIKMATHISAGQTISLPIRTNHIPKGSYLLVCKTSNLPMAKQIIILQ